MKRFLSGVFFFFITVSTAFSAKPEIHCGGLPGCESGGDHNHDGGAVEAIVHIIGLLIQYVAVIAVIVLMLAGIMYLVSGGDEEKVKKAKTWIMWSLIGVILSVSAWTIINIINNITITL